MDKDEITSLWGDKKIYNSIGTWMSMQAIRTVHFMASRGEESTP